MLHSFRAIEGCLLEWAKVTFPNDFIDEERGFPLLKDSILDHYPSLKTIYDALPEDFSSAQWKGELPRKLLEAKVPAAAVSKDFQAFWKSKNNATNLPIG
jgi:hypothetical protein